jgi:phosphoglycerate kinase
MAFTFIKAQGGSIGKSICEDDKMPLALSILEQANKLGVQIHLPVDVRAAQDFSNEATQQIFPINEIPDEWEGMDAGPASEKKFDAVVKQSKTILWNGPLGVFEFSNFATGTISLGNSIVTQTAAGAFSLVGGGDSVAAVKQFKLEEKVSYVSTGGGAMLESLEGKTLPGIAAMQNH